MDDNLIVIDCGYDKPDEIVHDCVSHEIIPAQHWVRVRYIVLKTIGRNRVQLLLGTLIPDPRSRHEPKTQ